MSEENVEIVRRFYDAYVRGDLESALAAFDPEIKVNDHDIPESGEYRGFEGLFRRQADWESSWESWRWEPEEFIEAGERVVAVLRVHAKGRHSGVDVERVDGAVWTLREGKCVRLDYYGSREQASKPPGCRSRRRG